MSHTPGPWVVLYTKLGAAYGIEAPGDKGVRGAAGCVVRWSGIGIPSSETGKANARLIAASPDLLAALKEVVAIADRKTDEFDRARAAIAKAEGKQP